MSYIGATSSRKRDSVEPYTLSRKQRLDYLAHNQRKNSNSVLLELNSV